MKKRRSVPLSTQLAVAKRQLAELMGVAPDRLQLEHRPALNFRPWNAAGTDTIPAANDPSALFFGIDTEHKVRTFGPGGEKRIHTRGSDRSEPGRLDKINRAFDEHIARVHAKILAAEPRAERKRPWPKRAFPKRKKAPPPSAKETT